MEVLITMGVNRQLPVYSMWLEAQVYPFWVDIVLPMAHSVNQLAYAIVQSRQHTL